VEALEKSFNDKGFTLQKISAVQQEVTVCRMIGKQLYPHTHIAIDIKKGDGKFKLCGLKLFSIEGCVPELLHVRLVKTTGHWNHIWGEYHHRENRPLQRSGDGPLKLAPKKTVQRQMQKRQNCRPRALLQDAGECVITGSQIIHACHVVPHCLGNDEYRRICGGSDRNEAGNLILMTPTLHVAFDRFMFGFSPTGRGTHAVEVYVSDPELDRHAGKIVRLAAGDAQLAAHRAACWRSGRSVGSQERDDEDPEWDARTAFSTACEDVRPSTEGFPDHGSTPTPRVSPAPEGSAEPTIELVGQERPMG
jgi:hypothetical protein